VGAVSLELLAYGHPLLATFSLLFAFFVFRDGFAQRKQRLRRIPAPPEKRPRHIKLGPWSSGLMLLSAVGGIGSTILIRKWEPLASFHGKLGLTTALVFALMWWLGRRLVAGDKHLAGRHGVIGLLAMFAGGLTGLLGISMLP
jgi:hypothetical protein